MPGEKRVILPGFREPSQLEGNIIYVTFYLSKLYFLGHHPSGLERLGKESIRFRGVCAKVVSNEVFRHNVHFSPWHDDEEWIRETRETYAPEGRGVEVLQDLVKRNDGRVDLSQLVIEGCEAYKRIELFEDLGKIEVERLQKPYGAWNFEG